MHSSYTTAKSLVCAILTAFNNWFAKSWTWKYHFSTLFQLCDSRMEIVLKNVYLFEMKSSLGYIFTFQNRFSFQVRLGINVGKIFMRYEANENDFMPTYSKCWQATYAKLKEITQQVNNWWMLKCVYITIFPLPVVFLRLRTVLSKCSVLWCVGWWWW